MLSSFASPNRKLPLRHRAKPRCQLALERLESRQLLNVDWRNPIDSLDVSADTAISPVDVLLIINRLNSNGAGALPSTRDPGNPFCDVNGDQQLTAQDALDVINALNDGLLGERDLSDATNDLESHVTLTVGQPQGIRTYRMHVSAQFAAGATDASGLAIYLLDPENPARALLDRGQPGSSLFQLSPSGASFSTDFAQWDGSILTLALPNFAGHDTGRLSLRYVNGDGIEGSRFIVKPLSNNIDAATNWPPFAPQALALTTHISPDSDPDGNGIVLIPHITVEGQTAPAANIQVTGANNLSLDATADAQGHYQFAIDVQPGINTFQLDSTDAAGRHATKTLTAKLGDVVLDWNASMLTVIRDFTTLSNDPYTNRVVFSPPPVVARNLAMVHAAMFDAINAVERNYQPYHVDLIAPAGTSPVVAAAAAAQRVASTLYAKIDELAIFNAALVEALNSVPDGPAKDQGLVLGKQVGDAIVAWRKTDGASAAVTYVPGTAPGQWQRTFPDYYPPLLPQWPKVTPFAMTSSTQFRPPPPPALDSPEYAAAVDEVQRLGSYTSTERTTEQSNIALFWADGGGTFTPPGHWNQIAADVALAQGTTLSQNARLFAMLNVAEADAAINCWDAKYYYGFWRPIDAIRKASIDGNDATVADATWIPLIRTPNFPSYTSGHSTFSAAAATVLNSVFGTNVSFTSVADDHTGFRERPLADAEVLTRSFTSFDQAAAEAGMSRIYGGIHYQFDNIQGQAAGRAIGQYVVANFFSDQ